MGELRDALAIIVALVIAVGATAVLVGDSAEQAPESPSVKPPDAQTEGPSGSQPADDTPSRQQSTDESNQGAGTNRSFEPGEPPDAVNEFAQFEEVATEIGFEYESIYRGTGLISRSGVYVVDYDNDGYEDLLATGGPVPVLFENTGDGYVPVREFDHSDTRAAHFFDYDNDGYRDLLLAEYGGELILYANDGGSFERREVGLEASVTSPTAITSADFTGNGCLDVFVAQNGLWQQSEPLVIRDARDVFQNHPDVRPRTTPGGENLLFYGDCEAFSEVTGQAGIRGQNWTLVTSAADFTGNGYPDIHVGNDYSADFLYENNGDGTFDRRDLGPATDRNAMSSVATDLTGNHHLDLFVTNIYFPDDVESTGRELPRLSAVPDGNNLLVNDGTGAFADVAPEHDLHRGGWGWAATVADFTNDGHREIVHATSSEVPVQPYDQYRGMQLWKGYPDTWKRVSNDDVGIGQHESRGLVRVDYDNDGRLDIAVATTTSTPRGGEGVTAFRFYENQHRNDESLQLFVRNPDGLARHAEVYVRTDARTMYRTVTARANFLSQDSRLLHFGVGNEEIRAVKVVWPDGTETIYRDLDAGSRYIVRPDGTERVE